MVCTGSTPSCRVPGCAVLGCQDPAPLDGLDDDELDLPPDDLCGGCGLRRAAPGATLCSGCGG